MSSGRKRIYRNRTPLRIAMTVLIIVLVLLLLISAIIFFSFQKYIVYTADGLRLEVPWLEDTMVEEDTGADDAISPSSADSEGNTNSADGTSAQ